MGEELTIKLVFQTIPSPFASVHPSLLTSSALLLSTISRFLASASRDLIRCSFFRVSFFSCAISRDFRASSTFFWFASDLHAAVGSDTIQCVNDRKHTELQSTEYTESMHMLATRSSRRPFSYLILFSIFTLCFFISSSSCFRRFSSISCWAWEGGGRKAGGK